MGFRVCWSALILLFFAALVPGCGPRPAQEHATTFSDRITVNQTESEPEPIRGRKDVTELAPVEIPKAVRERLPAPPKPPAAAFKVSNPKLVIDVDREEVRFQFTVTSKRGREEIELKGNFKSGSSPWSATLYATDEKILRERRVQAQFLCVTANYCDRIGVDIYYVVPGFNAEAFRMETGVSGPRIAMSGHGAPAGGAWPGEQIQEEPWENGDPDADFPPGDENEVSPDEPVQQDQPDRTEPQAGSDTDPKPWPDADPSPSAPVSVPPAAPAAPPPPLRDPETPKSETPKAPVQPAPGVPVPKPKPKPSPAPPEKKYEDLTPAERDAALIDVGSELNLPRPEKNPNRVPGIPENPDRPIIEQAIKKHTAGSLELATYIPPKGEGYVRTEYNKSAGWTTLRGLEFLDAIGRFMREKYPERPLYVGNASRQSGGKLGEQISHQNGLDLDLYFISKNSATKGSFDGVHRNGQINRDFDVAKNWDLFKAIVNNRPDWIYVIFIHPALKNEMCRFAKASGEPVRDPNSAAYRTLRYLYPEANHFNHFHVRLNCPGNSLCYPSRPLFPPGYTNGCN
jgi:murein endopeptidase